jgi:phosphate:Na+ symporter
MRSDLSQAQQIRCFQLKNLLIDIERVGDMAEDISQYAMERVNNQVPFSAAAIEELQCLWNHAHHTYLLSIEAFKDSDATKARQVCILESEFDRLYWQTRQSHIHRLAAGVCDPEADIIFTETVRNLERISDHADNLGVSVIRT